MELYKIVKGYNKKFYESKKSFEQYWKYHLRYAKHYNIIAYKLDWEKQDWVRIRRVGPEQ